MPYYPKKLIEVALPLDAINIASVREKSISHGHPSTLHLWWARRPLAVARAVIFAQLVDDPSAWPDLFPDDAAQEEERQRLFAILEQLVRWESTNDQEVLRQARAEIQTSWRRTCEVNSEHPQATELFDAEALPAFHDPFAGGGALPLEAQRLGLDSYASDLNPVAVLINKAMIDIPPRFGGLGPVNPDSNQPVALLDKEWYGAQGLAEDTRYYGKCLRDEAQQRIGHLYPPIRVTTDMTEGRPDLEPYIGRELTVIAWLWARTVRSPNPAFANVHVPLTSTYMLSTKKGRNTYLEPLVEGSSYRFAVRVGAPPDRSQTRAGTKLSRANFECILSGTPIPGEYIKSEGDAGRLGYRLLAIAVEGDRRRLYLPAEALPTDLAEVPTPDWTPTLEIVGSTQYIGVRPYGMTRFDQLFTQRQLVVLSTLSALVEEIRSRVLNDATKAFRERQRAGSLMADIDSEALQYADAVATYLGMCVSRQANRSSTLNFWDTGGEKIQQVFARQALSMTWDFVEGNPFSNSSGNFLGQIGYLTRAMEVSLPASPSGHAEQADAQTQAISQGKIISTDPPYYDNVPYADVSDFFYVWLRQALKSIRPEIFASMAVPKSEELVAFAYRHDGRDKAEQFFLEGMTEAMRRIAEAAHPAFPTTIFYAFRQAEKQRGGGIASSGWDAFLEAVLAAGFSVSGTWPARTEYTGNLKTKRNALASSIILVCRRQPDDAPTTTRRDFVSVLRSELPATLATLQRRNIAPVDLAQASIGPGMAIFTRFRRVLDASGEHLTVRDALVLINQTLDEILAEQEGDFDADTRWALAWYEQHGFEAGEYGSAETLSKAKNTSVEGMEHAGIIISGSGKVRLLQPGELREDWDPESDSRLTVWEVVQHLVRVSEAGGEAAAADLVMRLGGRAHVARELAYRLYNMCERSNRAQEARTYNALVQSWPEISRLAHERSSTLTQPSMFDE